MFIYGKTAANAISVISYLTAASPQRVESGEIAEKRSLSKALTRKLLTQLATAGLIIGQPGPNGGYTLAKPAHKIRLIDIVSLFEQTESISACPFGPDWCGKGEPCPLHDRISGILRVNAKFMEKTNLSIFSKKNSNKVQ